MAIEPDRPERDQSDDAIDASINARLTRHLMENAVKAERADVAASDDVSLRSRLLVGSGIAFLMSVLGLFSLMDRRQRLL